jgi:alkanesulfonate monooxygenase SsuD/methylene tetrahydromethanopterin reductase-like flavin-dependent oxidoreductase (luciferase family)
MELRLGVHYELLPAARRGERSAGAPYPVLLDQARRAEAIGFDAVWVSERPDLVDAGLPAALPLCGALAVGTRRMRIGTGVLPLPLYHPLRVAEDAATLDGLSGGRLDLGVGLGADMEGFQSYGVTPRERGTRLEEAIEVLRQALSGREVDFAGCHYRISGVRIVPPPVQPGGPPLWVGAEAEVALRRVARLGLGVLAATPQGARSFLAAWHAQGRDPARARIAIRIPFVVSNAPDRGSGVVEDVETLGPPAATERIRRELLELASAGRVDLLVPGFPKGLGPELALETLRCWAEQVLPELGI